MQLKISDYFPTSHPPPKKVALGYRNIYCFQVERDCICKAIYPHYYCHEITYKISADIQ